MAAQVQHIAKMKAKQLGLLEDGEEGGREGEEEGEGEKQRGAAGWLCARGAENTGRWRRQEHDRFVGGLKKWGKEWKKVAGEVRTRTVVQTRTHAQKYFQKLQVGREGGREGRRGGEVFGIERAGKRRKRIGRRRRR